MLQEPMFQITFDKLSQELEELKNKERAKIAKIIEEARALGDLKENAEYHAAKEKQGLMESRISNLTSIIAYAKVINPSKFLHKKISFGSTCILKEKNKKDEILYSIVGKQESKPENGLISIQSPLARVLIGKSAGEKVEISLPDGEKVFSIIKVYYRDLSDLL